VALVNKLQDQFMIKPGSAKSKSLTGPANFLCR
jgi:hypothetical protein